MTKKSVMECLSEDFPGVFERDKVIKVEQICGQNLNIEGMQENK